MQATEFIFFIPCVKYRISNILVEVKKITRYLKEHGEIAMSDQGHPIYKMFHRLTG